MKMVTTPHRAPSVGSVIKKIVEINPALTTQEVIGLVRKAVKPRGQEAGEFSSVEVVDENLAIELAKKTLRGR